MKGARLAALALGIAMVPALAACGGKEDAGQPAAKSSAPGYTVGQVDAPRWQAVSAEISTEDEAQALARIPGILASLSVRDGDMVKKGQAIGRIVDSQLGYQAGAYGAQAAAAQAQAAQAQAELARTRFLTRNGVYSTARLEQAQAAASAAQAQVRAAQAQQSAVNAVAGQGAVLAPATGRVLHADVPAGSAVAPGMVIATVTSGPVLLRLDLPESLVGTVHAGSQVKVAMPGGQELTGAVRKVYPSVAGGSVRADVDVPGLDGSLIGRRVEARVEAGMHQAIIVPKTLVTTRYGIDYVSIRGKDGALSTVPVQTAPAGSVDQVEVLAGVAAGDVLVAGGMP
ncbi:MAG: efflux RND transporter periplasmic adaptor subunit [Sphingomonadales bacterium]|nr:efflux RND transporter periplasmic adaptor subunit [Sphingomonadales bacterium]MDE2569283.1 efflux RND transporter periplasmic adaptor subunit [Sphingomonadales bacterium]